MKLTPTVKNAVSHTALSRFVRSESGSLTNLTVASSVIMLIFGGLGIDFMVAEMRRAKAQQTLDRAVLAGAALNQELDAKAVVNDYFARSGVGDLLADVQSEEGLNFRRVTADTNERLNPAVTHNFGINFIDVQTDGEAQQSARSTEISLVLDISQSMSQNSRMTNMQAAARDFVDLIIDDSYPNVSSISLVPYTEHVNVGPAIFSRFPVNVTHGASHCIEVDDSDMDEAYFAFNKTYDQVQHYQWNYDGATNDTSNPICPDGAAESVTPLSNDGPALIAQINAMNPLNGTSIFMGLKWGTALLDPSLRNVVTQLTAATPNVVPPAFAGRPLDYNLPDSTKHIVLMTDGENDDSFRIRPQYYNDSPAEIADGVDYDGDGIIGDITFWQNNNFWHHVGHNVHWTQWGNYYNASGRYSRTLGDRLTRDICDAAKDSGIVIWTIAFETTSAAESLLRGCATSNAHAFTAEGTEISSVFAAIARAIRQVKLTQ